MARTCCWRRRNTRWSTRTTTLRVTTRVVRPDDQLIGSIRVDISETGEAGLRLVAIDPSLQGRGCGRALLRLAEAFARSQGCTRAVLYATPEAVGFYTKAGYAEEDWDDVYTSGVCGHGQPLG